MSATTERASQPPKEQLPDIAKNIEFISALINKLTLDPFDLSGPRYYLQMSATKKNIAVINVSLDSSAEGDLSLQRQYAELRVKRDDMYAHAQRLLSQAFSGWKAEVKNWEKQIRNQLYNDGKSYTAFNCPKGKWVDYDKNGAPRPTADNAIVAIRHIDMENQIIRKYDLWKRQRVQLHLFTGRPIIDDYKDENVFLRELQNTIATRYKLSFSEPVMREALSRLTINNQFHSMKDRCHDLKEKWINKGIDEWKQLYGDRDVMDVFCKDIYHMDGTALQRAVMKKWLMAAVLRVYVPGLKFDLIPYWWSRQGYTKTYSLAALFGSDNVLEENILTYGSKESAEMTYHGIICVEIADPDYEKTTGGKQFKAKSTRRSFRGRFAYARMEEMQTTRITFVFVLTGNKAKILYDSENRRVVPMELLGEIDAKLLLRLRDYILGYAVDEAEKAWLLSREALRSNSVNLEEMLPWDIKCDAIMLDEPELRAAAAELQNQAKADNPYAELLADAVCWNSVRVEPDKFDKVEHFRSATYYLASDDIRQHLNHSVGYQWNNASQKIAEVLDGIVVLSKDEWREIRDEWTRNWQISLEQFPEMRDKYNGELQWLAAHQELSQDIVWSKKQIKRHRKKFNGYRIDLDGPQWKNDFEILEKYRADTGLISKGGG